MHLFLQDLWIYMYLFILLLKLLILHLGKRSFEPFKITFLEKALYFINVLTKRNNLSHSEAIFICQFPQNMKVGVAGHTFFEKSNEVNFLNSRAIVSFHAKFQVNAINAILSYKQVLTQIQFLPSTPIIFNLMSR